MRNCIDFFKTTVNVKRNKTVKIIFNNNLNGTLSAMLNEFAGIRKVPDEFLGRDETLRHTSHEI